MVFRKNCMSGVYENVFETSEISLLLSLRDGLLFTICVRIPCSILFNVTVKCAICADVWEMWTKVVKFFYEILMYINHFKFLQTASKQWLISS